MDAGERGTGADWAGGGRGEGVALAPGSGRRRPFGSERVGQILGEWQGRELRVARGFVECRGLSKEQLEDIYQETTLALYSRPYDSEEHLRNALRDGIKKRALRLHRDEHRHGQIRARSAPGLRLMAETREEQTAPEPAVLAKEDRLIALEFKTELDEDEQRVFAWLVEGLQYRAVASVLNIPVNEARNTARSCERKRERFQLLYDTGRLCGYRAQTILALQNGEATSEVLAERAFAHLESCAHCRLEHRTNAKRLRRSFRDQAAALLPPVFIGHLGWLARLDLRARLLLHRLGIDTAPVGQGGVRERAVALLRGWRRRREGRRRSRHRWRARRWSSRHARPRAGPLTAPPPRRAERHRRAPRSPGHRAASERGARGVAEHGRPPQRAYLQAPAPFQLPASACEHPADERHERSRAARTGRVCLPRRPHEHQPSQRVGAGGEHLSTARAAGVSSAHEPDQKICWPVRGRWGHRPAKPHQNGPEQGMDATMNQHNYGQISRPLLLTLTLALAVAGGGMAASGAYAGSWMEVSCVNPSQSAAPSEGWSSFAAGGGYGSNNSTGCGPGSPMFAILSTDAAVGVGSAETLQYTPPGGSALIGGSIDVSIVSPTAEASTPRAPPSPTPRTTPTTAQTSSSNARPACLPVRMAPTTSRACSGFPAAVAATSTSAPAAEARQATPATREAAKVPGRWCGCGGRTSCCPTKRRRAPAASAERC